jgi:hypothetical protein
MRNEGNAYPPAKRWRELTGQEQADRLDTAGDLLALLQWHRGDPRLTPWEEGFLTGMVRALQDYRGKAKVSPKQWDNIQRILQKLEREPAEQGTEEEEEA